MKIEIQKVTSWIDAVNAARFTQSKKPIHHEPSDTFKKSIILAEHSPLREVMYKFFIYDVPHFVMCQLVRHNEGINKYVGTSRPDITGVVITRHEQRKDDLCNVQFTLNAQAIINMSRWRLCVGTVEPETRMTWEAVLSRLYDIDPILADKCVPTCLYRGFCTEEKKCCGYVNSKAFAKDLEEYRSCGL